jgi:NAD(P)-dependent dehydrogenase (short-subunit alcohol dehydrogenase family)
MSDEPFGIGPILSGKVAVVTGGGGGSGRSTSIGLAEAGARVVVAEKNQERCGETVDTIKNRGGTAVPYVVDVQQRDAARGLIADAVSRFGKVDVLVNNLGHFGKAGLPFHETTEDDWADQYSINLEHVFRCTHAVLPGMIERGQGGCIVSVSTIEAFRGIPGCVAYSAFKGAITSFTQSLALEVGRYGIRVNAIAPDMIDSIQLPLAERPNFMPIDRWGTPRDIAGCVLYLASDLASYVTGTTMHVDGGMMAAGGAGRAWTKDHSTAVHIGPS